MALLALKTEESYDCLTLNLYFSMACGYDLAKIVFGHNSKFSKERINKKLATLTKTISTKSA